MIFRLPQMNGRIGHLPPLEGLTDEDEPKKGASVIERNTTDLLRVRDSLDKDGKDVNRTTITVKADDESKI